MPIQALDTIYFKQGHAHDLWNLGYRALGIYLRDDRVADGAIDGWREVGGSFFLIFEHGNPTSADYFTSEQAAVDAQQALETAHEWEFPGMSQIYFAFDYDATPDDAKGPLASYMADVHHAVRMAGMLASCYGSGLVCKGLVDLGLAHSGYLSVSRGWRGYESYRGEAAIVQTMADQVVQVPGYTFSVDLDTVLDTTVLC